jgi:transcriptional regulator GlxA family with amidase domain
LLRDTSDQPLSIRAIAKDAGLSPYQFIRRFHAVFGETPREYRIRARLDRARELLLVSSLSVTDVCLEVGYSSLGSFSDLFARRMGEAPSAYRRRMRPLVQVPGTMPEQLVPGCLSLMCLVPGRPFAIPEKQGPPAIG